MSVQGRSHHRKAKELGVSAGDWRMGAEGRGESGERSRDSPCLVGHSEQFGLHFKCPATWPDARLRITGAAVWHWVEAGQEWEQGASRGSRPSQEERVGG